MKYLRKPFRYTYDNVCLKLIIINAAAFIILRFLKFIGINIGDYLALTSPHIIIYKWFWQVFTYQFLHADFWHLFFNMLALFFFGTPIEKRMGSKEFLLFYLLCGTLCGIAGAGIYYVMFLKTFMPVMLIGASGTVFAVMLAYAVLFPTSNVYFWGLFPIPAPVLIVGYALVELFNALFIHDGIAHSIHLLGLLWSFLYMRVRFGIKPIQVWKDALR